MKKYIRPKYIINIIILLSLLFLVLLPIDVGSEKKESEVYLAKITDELSEETEKNYDIEVVTIKYLATIIDERYNNEIITIEDVYESTSSYHIRAEEGDEVFVYLEMGQDGSIQKAYLAKFRMENQVYLLLLIFAILIIIVGRLKGIKALLSLTFTLLLVVKVFIPQILKGNDPIVLSIIMTILMTLVTIILVGGFTKKSLVAILGTLGGVLIAGILATIVSRSANIIGLTYEESLFLRYIPQGTDFSFSGLLFAAILLGALGAVMDVSMSIASSVNEIKNADPSMGVKELYNSGINVGRDVMGTMVNTLILAYTGSSISLLILYIGHNVPLVDIINNDTIVTEIIRAFAGTIGLIVTIPFTALISAISFSNHESE